MEDPQNTLLDLLPCTSIPVPLSCNSSDPLKLYLYFRNSGSDALVN